MVVMVPLAHRPLSSPVPGKRSRVRSPPSSSMASPVLGFPYLSRRHRELMVSLHTEIESRIGPTLLPSAVSPDVLSFSNRRGTSHGALDIRSGAEGSPVDLISLSWLHCEVPTGALDITTLFAFLDASTDAPHLLMEFIQSSTTSVVLFLDLLPRRDFVLHPDYLDEYYHRTHLDGPRQRLAQLPQVEPFLSSSLYIRGLLSPTAITASIKCGSESEMEEMMGAHIDNAAREVIRIWLDGCFNGGKRLGELERADMMVRDRMIKSKAIELDLAENLPKLFDSDVASRVVGEVQKAFRIQK